MQAGPRFCNADRRYSAATARVEVALRQCLREMVEAFRLTPASPSELALVPDAEQRIFTLLTSRAFSYLGRSKSEAYRERAMRTLCEDVAQARPARFFFDIGPGYHASLAPDETGLKYDIGLAEFLALRQVKLFDLEVRSVYPPGVKFFLVIDNLCGLYTNDVSLADSSQYVRHLRRLIGQLHMDDIVEVLVESELISTAQYEAVLSRVETSAPATVLSEDDIDNVARFLGRPCSAGEAAERIARYARAGTATEMLLAEVVDGVRLTQRATETTLGFRSFPGGAQRIQAGDIMILVDHAERTRPVLLTSRNQVRYDIRTLAADGTLPLAIPEVRYVRALTHPNRRQRSRL